jgi:dolichol-phosphate mannosyltransferase
MSRRFGVTPCVVAGMKYATGDALIYMDSDLQDPPEIIPRMIEKYLNGADVVHTVRTKRFGENKLKLFLTKRAYSTINLISEISLLTNSGDFKLLSKRAANELISINDFDPYIRGLCAWVGFNQTFIEYERDARFAGSTKFSLLTSLNPYKEFVRGITSFSLAPLYFALILGFIISAISFASLAWVITTKLMGLNLPGWTAVMAIVSLTSGISLLTVGIVGIYVGKIYQQVLNRPKYIVENTIGF